MSTAQNIARHAIAFVLVVGVMVAVVLGAVELVIAYHEHQFEQGIKEPRRGQ